MPAPTQLPDFLARTDILICLLPETDDTRHLLDADLLRQCRAGGRHQRRARQPRRLPDLLAALDEGQLSAPCWMCSMKSRCRRRGSLASSARAGHPHAAATPSRRASAPPGGGGHLGHAGRRRRRICTTAAGLLRASAPTARRRLAG
jgi:glyoxylate/hydroxypyruvate reductase A